MKKNLVFALLLLLTSCNFEDSTVDLNANISKSETQLLISNNDVFDYKNCKIKINEDYIYKMHSLRSKEKAEVGLLNFYDSDGNKFNPFLKKIMSVSIWCDLPNEKNGFMYGEFN